MKKILLADDSITIQKVISITFASEDYDLIIVGDGDSAVAKAKEVRPDLIMADVGMPGKNGYEACEAVKNDPGLATIPVMLLAGTFEPLNEEEASRVRADDHIVKPFESEALIQKVKNLLERPPEEVAAPGALEAEPIEAEPFQPGPLEAEGTSEPQEAKPPVPENIWEAGDFMKPSEEVGQDTAESEAAAPDFDLMEEVPEGEAPAGEGEGSEVEEPEKEEPQHAWGEFEEPDLSEEAQAEEKAEEGTGEFEAPEPIEPEPSAPEAGVEEKAPEQAQPTQEGLQGISGVPRERVEEIISKVARDVIEEVAWEVVPELAEELIRNEILDRVRESLTKKK
jgi:CheY-like chemotaxis protein